MNFINNTLTKRIAVALLATCSLSGCYSLSNLWPDALSAEPAKLTNAKFLEAKLVNSSDKQAKLEGFVKEWESVRPALMRVVALEEDMQFLLQSMSDVNDVGPVYSASNPILDVSASIKQEYTEAEVANYVGRKHPKTPEFSQERLQGKSLSGSTNTMSKVKAVPAPKTMATNNQVITQSLTQTQKKTMDNKFSSKPSNQPARIAQQKTFISELAANYDCSDFSRQKIGEGNAIHLVSYKSKQRLVSGSEQLTKKFSDVLCGKMPIFKEVIVNGNMFYSMRFGPFINKSEALKACSNIKKTGQYCGVTKFDGAQIL